MDRKRILLVDDNESIHLDFLKAYDLNKSDISFDDLDNKLFNQEEQSSNIFSTFPSFHVDSVYQGLDAVRLVREQMDKKQRYALAFIDMRMPPGIDGVTTIEKLWEIDPELQVVICTAYSDYSFEEIYQRLKGSDNFLILKKPFDIIEILQLTSSLTKKWELSQLAKTRIIQQDIELQYFFREADFLYKLSQLAQTELSINQVLQFYIDNICEVHHWEIGHIYKAKNSASTTLYSTNIWYFNDTNRYVSLQSISNEAVLKPGVGLPGRVLESKECVWVEDITLDNNFPGLNVLDSGIRGAFAVPIKVDNKIYAVAEFFSLQAISKNKKLLQLTEASANQLGLLLESRQNEKLIKENYKRLELVYQELKNSQAQLLQQDKLASIGQLAAGVAHEINNPIAFTASNAETLLSYCNTFKSFFNNVSELISNIEFASPEEIKQKWQNMLSEKNLSFIIDDSLELISESLEGLGRVSEIVTDLKTFSHMNEAELQETDINKCLETTLKLIWNELKYKCTVTKQYGDLPLLRCFPRQLNQVFMNLLLNACQAIPDKGEIKITTSCVENVIKISIEDTGTGISAENIEKLFDPFFTTKPIGQGTGLGLSISYNIIQKHNGEIKATSNGLNKGTTFTVLLPLNGIPGES